MTTKDKRVTISLDDESLAILDRWADRQHEGNRSRMVRDMVWQYDASRQQATVTAPECSQPSLPSAA